MIARWLRRLLLLETVLYALLVAWWFPADSLATYWPWLSVPAAVLLVRTLWLLNIHLIGGWYAEPIESGHSGFVQGMQAFGSEWLALIYLFVGVQPFARVADSDESVTSAAPGENAPEPVVVFVHGFGCNGAVWNPMRAWLRRQGPVRTYAITLEPVLCDLDRSVNQLQQFVLDVYRRNPACPILLVGHSMGGIVARRYLQSCDQPQRVRRLLTLGSPHAGTALARFHTAPNARQMRPGSDWLRRLNADPDPVEGSCVLTGHDRVVVPQSSACYPGARCKRLHGVGHLALLLDGRVRDMLRAELLACAESGPAGGKN